MATHDDESSKYTPRFVEDAWPLVVCVSPLEYGPRTVEEMAAGYERLFARGERYALITVTPNAAAPVAARERKKIADWANTPRVRAKSGELCVGSATVVPNTLARGALTAILWLFKPAAPHHTTTSTEEALDWCLAKLEESGVERPLGAAAMRAAARRVFRDL